MFYQGMLSIIYLLRNIFRHFPRSHLVASPQKQDTWIVDFTSILFLSVFVASVSGYYISASYLGAGYPYNTFLLNPAYSFGDYQEMVRVASGLNPYLGEVVSAYPPFGNLFMSIWAIFPGIWGILAFNLASAISFFALYSWLVHRSGLTYRFQVFVSLYLCAYPILFCIDRGNSEIFVALFIGIFVLFYNANTPIRRNASLVALALAVSLKIVPVIFASIYIKDRRWRDLLNLGIVIVVIGLGSLLLFKGDVLTNATMFGRSLVEVQKLAASDLLYAGFSTNLVNGIRLSGLATGSGKLADFATDYYLACVLVVGLLVNLKLWSGIYRVSESAVCLAALACLLPAVSADYKLCSVYVAGLVLIFREGGTSRLYRTVVAIILCLVCAPKNWFILVPKEIRGDIGISSILTPVLLLALVLFVLNGDRFKSAKQYAEDSIFALLGLAPSQAKRRTVSLAVFFSALCLLAGSVSASYIFLRGPSIVQLGLVKIDSDLSYQYGDSRPPICAPPHALDSRIELLEFNLDLDFVARPNVQAENLFDTSEKTDGVRMEYSNGPSGTAGTLVLVHGLAHDVVQVHHISDSIKAGIKYNCQIALNKSSELKIFLNNKEVSVVRPRPGSFFSFEGLRLGSRFKLSQAFSGAITLRTFSGSFGLPSTRSDGWRNQQLLLSAIVILTAISFSFLRFVLRRA